MRKLFSAAAGDFQLNIAPINAAAISGSASEDSGEEIWYAIILSRIDGIGNVRLDRMLLFEVQVSDTAVSGEFVGRLNISLSTLFCLSG